MILIRLIGELVFMIIKLITVFKEETKKILIVTLLATYCNEIDVVPCTKLYKIEKEIDSSLEARK